MKVLFLAIVPIVGFAVGWWLAQRGKARAALSKTDRLELSRLRLMRDQITTTAIEHSQMGEPGAVIILDQINQIMREDPFRKGGGY